MYKHTEVLMADTVGEIVVAFLDGQELGSGTWLRKYLARRLGPCWNNEPDQRNLPDLDVVLYGAGLTPRGRGIVQSLWEEILKNCPAQGVEGCSS